MHFLKMLLENKIIARLIKEQKKALQISIRKA